MSRRSRYRECKRWRTFISLVNKSDDEESVRDIIMEIDCVRSVQVQHGWTTWVTVMMNNNEAFIERKFWAIDSLKKIAFEIYISAITKYLTRNK